LPDKGFIDYEYLSKLEACYETEMIRHVYLKNNLQIIINGQNRVGVILKEGVKLV